MDAVIYVRWSSAEQARGSSKARQLETCHEHAAKKGWNVVDTFLDDGVSAFKGRHSEIGELGKFVAKVEAGEYPHGVVLLTEKLDRLSREEPGRVFIWLTRITEAGVIVATAEGDRQYRAGHLDMANIIEVVVKAQLAHEESSKKSDRLAAAWRKKREKLVNGEPVVLTRRAPAWIKVEGTPPAFVLIEERAAIVRRIFKETIEGYGKHSIARRLNQEGVATFGRAEGWHASYIQKILNSATVLGEMQPGRKPRGGPRELVGDPIAGYYPNVVDADVYAKAQAAMSGRSRRVAGRGRRLVNIFGGIARCDACGEKMTFRGKGEKVRANGDRVSEDYLICDSYQRGCGCTNGQHFNYQAWEGAVLNAVLSQAMGDEHFASKEEVRRLEVEQAEILRGRDDARRKADAALNLFLETERAEAKHAWSTLTVKADEAEAALGILQKRIEAARGVVTPAEHQRRIADLFDQMVEDDEERRFAARARVMEAVHGLVASMRFRADPPTVEVTTKGGIGASIECVGGKGPDTEFLYGYDEGFFG